jgi:hypothetical protein
VSLSGCPTFQRKSTVKFKSEPGGNLGRLSVSPLEISTERKKASDFYISLLNGLDQPNQGREFQ